MKQLFLLLTGLMLALLLANCGQNAADQTTAAKASNPQADSAATVKRGEYLVTIMGCDDCHTPKKMTEQGPAPDMSRRLMGHPAEEPYTWDDAKGKLIREQFVGILSPGLTAAAGPWGVSYAANLTPDDTGTGNWTEAQFAKALREGKSKGLDGTRPLLPPMPWQNYRALKDEDVHAIFAYTRTLTPVKNVAPNPVPPSN